MMGLEQQVLRVTLTCLLQKWMHQAIGPPHMGLGAPVQMELMQLRYTVRETSFLQDISVLVQRANLVR